MPILNTLLQCIMRGSAYPSERQEYRTIPTQFFGNSGSLNSTHHRIALRQPADQRRQPRRAGVGLVDKAAEPALQARGVGGLQEGLGGGTPGTKPAGPASGRRRPGGPGRRGPPRPWRLRWACRTERRAPAAPAAAPARRPGPGDVPLRMLQSHLE